jgi:predicted phage replisome organizer
MFDNRKIRHLRRLPEGNNIVLIWVMLLTMAGRCNSNGMIFLTENIPYTTKMLADELDFEENTVKLALTVLEQLDMVVTNQGYFAIAGWNEHQNVEGLDKIREQNRIRQQKRREKTKQALIGNGNTCEYCGQAGSTVDHIIPKAKGGLDVPENTVCSCLTCNMTKSDRSIDIFLNEMIDLDSGFDVSRILTNNKIMKYVVYDGQHFMSRDITLHVTHSHATEKEIEKESDIEIDKKNSARQPSKADVDSFFESVWNLYPVKKGKGQVSDTKRKVLFKIGYDQIERAINRYLTELKKDASWRKPQNGSTFFNSGYVDYLDENYAPDQTVMGGRTEKLPEWFGRRELDDDERAAIQRMMSKDDQEEAEQLRRELQESFGRR